ncbi:MAG TPA: hydrogenase maturation protease [Vicinamibacterales bacterium]|nr:hydrogenase maturation protease [Vicinamibacterales bacterium]
MARTLVAGFGNVLRADDGFGVEVVRRLERELGESRAAIERAGATTGSEAHAASEGTAGGRPGNGGGGAEDVVVAEIGTGGVRLVQELLAGFDRLVIVDAVARGGPPGALYVTRLEHVEPVAEIDPHELVPARALAMARALGVLPREVFFVGCEPQQVEELSLELSPPVREAVDRAIAEVRRLLAGRF